jgi:hypothetical protein
MKVEYLDLLVFSLRCFEMNPACFLFREQHILLFSSTQRHNFSSLPASSLFQFKAFRLRKIRNTYLKSWF